MSETHLPLKLVAPSQIETADGWSINIPWFDNRDDNPWQQSEDFAPFIVRAVNSHPAMLEALRQISKLQADKFNDFDDVFFEARGIATLALAKVEDQS